MVEREMEELLWRHPEKLLNEPLKPFRRQPVSQVGRADLVFLDRLDRILVVELKKGVLPRGAIDQVVDYFGMLKKEFPDKPVELMVVANAIPHERALACLRQDIEPREISEKRFRDVANAVGFKFESENSKHVAVGESGSAPFPVPAIGRAPRKVEKAWGYLTQSEYGPVLLAFVNQKGNSSVRFFDTTKGFFLGKRYGDGDYQEAFKAYFSSAKPLVVSRQPNLEKHCKVRLPDHLLVELRSQIDIPLA